jgi:hypothetical protein
MNMLRRTRRLLRQHNLAGDVSRFAKRGRRNQAPLTTRLAVTAAVSLFFAILVMVHVAAATYALT